eukprot:356868-Chlamydomonas_euryale.AAC.9
MQCWCDVQVQASCRRRVGKSCHSKYICNTRRREGHYLNLVCPLQGASVAAEAALASAPACLASDADAQFRPAARRRRPRDFARASRRCVRSRCHRVRHADSWPANALTTLMSASKR